MSTTFTQSKLKNPEILNWVFFISKGIKDNTDLMRTSILCMEICSLCEKGIATIEAVKNSIGYSTCLNDIPAILLTDEVLQEMIDFK